MSSNADCNQTRDLTNQTPVTRSSDFVNHLYDYRPNWTPLSPVTIINNFILPFENLGFLDPLPLRISNDHPWGGDAYFLEPLNCCQFFQKN